ncbi:IclR family transcriptional regulator [Pseudoroseicyclus sp. CXY001]|uniref:IclR family transcriptional regulator n=1 Tax=Pseudoroseicyclus sp. CXY001 TaxID=3242492 RepID=UPI0035709DFC
MDRSSEDEAAGIDETGPEAEDDTGEGGPPARQRGIQSIDQSLLLLKCMMELNGPVTLTELAQAAGMPASKAHRYLASFAKAGMVFQRQRSGRYQLGNLALELGLAAMNLSDFTNRTADRLYELMLATDSTALLSVWGNHGPTIVRWERAESLIATSLGLGTTLPLLNSANGLIFFSYLPRRFTTDVLRRELKLRAKTGLTDLDTSKAGLEELIRQTRARGFANGHFIPGLHAVSAPILDWQGEAVAGVSLITNEEVSSPENEKVRRLLAFCAENSAPAIPQGRAAADEG